MATIAEVKKKIQLIDKQIAEAKTTYLKEVYTEQRGRYVHEITRQLRFAKEQTHGKENKDTHHKNTSGDAGNHRRIPRK